MFRLYPAAAVAGVLFLAANPAHAQTQRGPYIGPDVKGFRMMQLQQQWQQNQAQAATPSYYYRPTPAVASTPAQQPVEVHIAIAPPPSWNPPASVAIRGPGGELRTFPVVGGQAALQSQTIVVRPGQTVTVVFGGNPRP